MKRPKKFSYSLVAKILGRDSSGVTCGIQNEQYHNRGWTTRQSLLSWLRKRLPENLRNGTAAKSTKPLPVDLPLTVSDEDLLKALGIPDPGNIELENPSLKWRDRPKYAWGSSGSLTTGTL